MTPQPPKENIGLTVSLGEIYSEVKELRHDVTKLLSGAESSIRTTLDHESRIRKLENRSGVIAGMAILVSLVVAAVAGPLIELLT